ncbi:MAG: GlsB/YeaQ/YmgE family stress response membrane protein [Acidobacteria bacterium]|nr:GlsB/YeaQ/YmgE family stress response membrane protein [Acidobacteriota bacterium]
MLDLLGTAIFGLLVGIIAKWLLPGKDPGGIIVTMLLGIAGAFVGSWMGRRLFDYAPGERAGWLLSIAGAIVLLLAYRILFGSGSSKRS